MQDGNRSEVGIRFLRRAPANDKKRTEMNWFYDKKRTAMNWFYFVCTGCGTEGELGVDVRARGTIGCPEHCGATYIMWYPTRTGDPALRCVVCPTYEKEA